MKLLVANRGEIARRIIRTAKSRRVPTVAVFAEPDTDAPFVGDADQAVRIGPAALADSYLSIDAILAAAERTGATHVHPGYGFLAENAAFASAVVDAGLTWVGPKPEAIEAMGSKIEARSLAERAGVPIIVGYNKSQDDADLASAADDIGYPILVKASAGGGGKGIRVAHSPDEFATALNDARTEAQRAFGNGDVIVERFVERPRHVEVQVVGDKHGDVADLGTRECSIQRRYQKVWEEAPAPNLPEATDVGLREAARKLAAAIGYDSAGTVEFIVDADRPTDFFFLEMNTRIQVEHTVTEEVTGIDLIGAMFDVADGARVGEAVGEVTFSGHAIEVRVNAEDAWNGFVPQTGTVGLVSVPRNVRWDAGIEPGSEISPHYDSMIGKLIVHGPDRAAAVIAVQDTLDEVCVGGPVTNTGFLWWLARQPDVVAGTMTTRWLDEIDLPEAPDAEPAARAAAWAWRLERWHTRSASSPWNQIEGRRITPQANTQTVEVSRGGESWEFPASELEADGSVRARVDRAHRRAYATLRGETFTFEVPTRAERWNADATDRAAEGDIAAPFPAVVAEVKVAPGDTVETGDTVVVIEAMKMLHSLAAHGAGTVEAVNVAEGDQVATGDVLVKFVSQTGEDK
ncbi:MAG: ATP-grasp domain-containing protein [Actinomycetia bacterium]|nr:ATP-grasp domain-containing protein [Actinomycetes bacterium]